MSLRDAVKPVMTEELYVMHSYPVRYDEHVEIELHTEQFLRNGGKIDFLPSTARAPIESIKERSDATRQAMLVIDKRKLKEFHKEGRYKHIKYVKKTRNTEEGFRVCSDGINLGIRPLLADAMMIKTKV